MFAAAALAGCKGKNGAGDVQQDNRVLTKTETAESATVAAYRGVHFGDRAFRENDITPAASGVHIDRILVEVGDPVHEGQLIVTLDPTQYTQQLVQLKTVEDDYNRLLPVYEAGGISAQQIQQAKRSWTCSARWSPTSRRTSRCVRPSQAWSRRATTSRATSSRRSPSCTSCRSTAEGHRQYFRAVFPPT